MEDEEHYAKVILAEIRDDMLRPFTWGGAIPWDVASFSALHDYCDANSYLLDFIPQAGRPWNEYMKFCDDIADIVSRALADEARALHTCPECSMELYANGPFDGTEQSSGVGHGHDGFGETFMCLDGHWFALILGALVRPENILTVVE